MKVSVLISLSMMLATGVFSAEGLSSVTWEGKQLTEISDVHITGDGKIVVMHAGGGLSTTEDKLPATFLQSWGITEEKIKSAKAARVKSAQDDFERALRNGLFREVGGIVYDLRKTQPDWVQFQRARVLQVLDDGVILDITPTDPRVTAVFVRNLSKTVSDNDTLTFMAKLTGSITFINKLGDDRTIRKYDVGRPCKRDEIPDAIAKENKLWGKLIGGASERDVMAKLPQSQDMSGAGTGFFVSEDGYLVTNFHVVEDAKQVKVKTPSGVFDAAIIKKDRQKDLALLKVGGHFHALVIAEDESVPLGAAAFTIGFPNFQVQGLEPKYTDGKISSLSGLHDDPSRYQISVPVQPGNSGGPLMDRNGRVIGVIVSRLNDIRMLEVSGQLPQNVNYAIKASVLRDFLTGVSGFQAPSNLLPNAEDAVKATEQGVAMVLVY